ncbi:MotA/TolQ/ExbB proton channel family protein [Flammeovirga yaeyamensis]|nr:MotA/TolQ/ExbB proton channel family protein [Flammeovirga yaeyamensis]NMF36775.1 MotA/TolQ/ExbB proton channel family protein [Flammeovirga yaeyamensis]
MSTLTIVGGFMVFFLVLTIMRRGKVSQKKSMVLMKEFGTLALVVGIFGQLIGLYSAMIAIEAAGGVPLALLAGGIKVSMITTLYGFLIFLISRIAGIILQATAKSE